MKVEKGGKVLAIRGEWAIPKLTTGKEKSNSEKLKPGGGRGAGRWKDSVNQTVISVDPKGDSEFVVLTVRQTLLLRADSDSPRPSQTTKSLSFVAGDSALRSKWVSSIQRFLDPTTA